ncbi:electron transfer flavoprotein subunit alpha/FixB family protein [Pediococcus argentinicus]|uniref:electron transfer flavoprotein subunit alpha/FixB family protein n=1 Tax=Pediococcus argentinicus TaxID=480391 RepID=UPI00338DEE34
MSEIWIYVENHFNRIDPSSLQLITKAKEIANGRQVTAVILEDHEQDFENTVKQYGPDQILLVKNDNLKNASDETITNVLVDLAQEQKPDTILFGATVTGRSLAPRLQGRLNTGLTADCLNLRFDNDLLVATKPSYGDNIMCEITCPKNKPQMATVRPNTFEAVVDDSSEPEINEVEVTVDVDPRVTVSDEQGSVSNTRSIGTAKRIIALGRGAQSESVIKKANELAGKIGAIVAVSRPLTDLPEFSHEQQIGQSGNTVAPDLIINLGISGAVQYVVGIQNAKTVVSVNTDPKAPIFDVSQYKYVGDAEAFLDGLIENI